MTTLMITNQAENIIEISNGKNTVVVSYFPKYETINVVQTSNASHRAWGGIGKTYKTWSCAAGSYRSAFMRDAIVLAAKELAGVDVAQLDPIFRG